MSNLAKLKKRAAEFEQKRQFDRALEAYEEVLRSQEGSEDADIALFNRVGDLQLRVGRTADALRSYERAVDLYSDRGFLNNAIALCNKILRQDPSRAGVHYKLGRVSAAKGFRSDAREHFLAYAELMQQSGKLDDAFAALREFADLTPEQDDVRLMLAEQLARHDRRDDALVQLRLVLERCEGEGRHADAASVRDRIRALDPSAADEPVAPQSRATPPEGGARPSGPRPAPDLGMPDIVLYDPSAAAAPPPPRATPVAPPAPDALIRGAEADLAARRLSFAEPYTLDDVLTGDEPRPAAEPPAGAESDARAVAEADAAGELLDATLADPRARPSGEITFALPPMGALGDPSAAAEAPAAPEFDPVLGDLGEFGDFSEPDLLDADPGAFPAPGAAPAAADALGDLVELEDDEGLTLEFELPPADDGDVAPPQPGADAAGDDDALDLWLPAPEPVAGAALPEIVVSRPTPWQSRLATARAALATGAEDDALRELSTILAELEASGDLAAADAAVDELIERAPRCLPLHERRVARVTARGERARIVAANLALAAAARDVGQPQLARVAYGRVLEVAPDHAEALAQVGRPATAPRGIRPVTPTSNVPTRSVMPTPIALRPVPSTPIGTRAVEPAPTPVASSGFVNLGDLLRDDDQPRSTRMVVEERAPSGDEEADFVAMLRKFKQGVAENVGDEDYDSHYDLGVAYKEMGLTDEAIAAFQRALRGTRARARTYEALGQCFLERGQHAVAAAVLQRATQEPGLDDQQLIGVLYLLGRTAEAMNQRSEALRYYERVLAVDITFSDVAERIGAVARVAG